MNFCVILFYYMYVLLCMSVFVVAIIIIIIKKEFLKFFCGTGTIGIKRSCMKKLTVYLN